VHAGKRFYITRHAARLAARSEIPFQVPESFTLEKRRTASVPSSQSVSAISAGRLLAFVEPSDNVVAIGDREARWRVGCQARIVLVFALEPMN